MSHRTRSTIVAAVALVVLTVAIAAATAFSGAATKPTWQTALEVRSDALNRQYGLGSYARKTASADPAAWLRALNVRSEALNRRYSLGR